MRQDPSARVARNEDKPHRCPECHGIALRAWSEKGYGPRTIMTCPRDCGVWWRAGVRGKRHCRSILSFLNQGTG